jgi:DNA-binding IclR family transcriptional regulator
MNELTANSPSVKSAFRALELLELLTHKGRPLSFSECQAALAYPKASLHSLLRTMTSARWITLDETSRKYALGVRVWEAGIAYTKMLPLEALARPIMERVRDATDETVQLAVLDGFEALYVAKVDGHNLLRLDSSVGMRLKAHATGVGKVLLAGVPDATLKSWLSERTLERYTPSTITSSAKLLKELAAIRSEGYANDREERTLGAACVAVGVRDHRGAVTAAMSVSAPAVRFGKKEQAKALAELQVAAAELSAALGHAPRDAAPNVPDKKAMDGGAKPAPRRNRRGNADQQDRP